MKSLYEPLSIVDYPLSIGNDTPPFDDSFYDAVVNELYGIGSYTPDYLTTPKGSALIGETNRVLMDGVTKGVSSITEEPDPAFSAALAQNTFIFSGFKTHQELQEVNSLLHDKDGNLRPYDDFKRDVLKLNKEYNQNYLQAEYNHAVQSAQMATKWQEFQKHKDFVNLQYRTAADERVRAEHAVLHGTTLPVEDKFWTKYLPPLGWNCRCTVVEVLKDSYPESNSDEAVRAGDSATSRQAEKIFRFNPGKELKVFPPKHPYLPRESQCSGCGKRKDIGLSYDPNSLWCKACNAIRTLFQKQCESKKAYDKNKADYEKYKADAKYENVRFNPDTGALIARHIDHNDEDPKTYLHHTTPDGKGLKGWELEIICAEHLFRMNNKVILLPEKQPTGISSLDLIFNDKYVDIKSITKNLDYYRNPLSAKNRQLKQWNRQNPDKTGDSVILYFHDPAMYTEKKVVDGIYHYLNDIKTDGKTYYGSSNVLRKVYCVINGIDEIYQYDVK